MAKLIVDFYAKKVGWLIYILKHPGEWFAPDAHLFSKRKGFGTFTGDISKVKRIKDTSKPAEKVSGAEVAKALGADPHIPLEWIVTFKLSGEILSLVFQDDIQFSADDHRLFFRKDDIESFVSVDLVKKVCEFSNTLKILWTDKQ